jgi:hypothetical protein
MIWWVGRQMYVWMDRWMGFKPGLKECLAQSKNDTIQNALQLFSKQNLFVLQWLNFFLCIKRTQKS